MTVAGRLLVDLAEEFLRLADAFVAVSDAVDRPASPLSRTERPRPRRRAAPIRLSTEPDDMTIFVHRSHPPTTVRCGLAGRGSGAPWGKS